VCRVRRVSRDLPRPRPAVAALPRRRRHIRHPGDLRPRPPRTSHLAERCAQSNRSGLSQVWAGQDRRTRSRRVPQAAGPHSVPR
jgi:hypothetical protein